MIKVLTIAGSDPSGGAGLQLDLKMFQALGAFGMAAPAALTAQNSRGVMTASPVASVTFREQLDALLSDIRPHAVKTGMLLTRKNVLAAAQALRRCSCKGLVVDPVIRSSSGATLLRPDALSAMKKHLLPLARVITPNIPEAELLSDRTISSEQDMDHAAGAIMDLGPAYVLIKGGHGKGAAVDTLYGGKTVLSFSTPRRKGEFHGTGCALSAAITVFIARGFPVEKAVQKAKERVDSLLKKARPMGRGKAKYFQFQGNEGSL